MLNTWLPILSDLCLLVAIWIVIRDNNKLNKKYDERLSEIECELGIKQLSEENQLNHKAPTPIDKVGIWQK